MTESKTYTGGCRLRHGAYECTADLAMVTACKLFDLTKKGLHFTFLPPSAFSFARRGIAKEYLFNKHAIRHQLSPSAASEVFAKGEETDGTQVWR